MSTLENVLRSRPVSYWVTVAAVLTVAMVAAVISYSHITDIALAAGESWRAYLIPWTFDGVVLAASMTMMIRRARKLNYGWLPLTALGVGVVGSIVANIANALARSQTILGNHGVAVMLAGFVPLAFLGCFHMLLGQHALVTISPDNTAPGMVGDSPVNSGIAGDSAGEPLALDAQPGQLDIADYRRAVAPVPGFAAVQGPISPLTPTTGYTGQLPRWNATRTDRDGGSVNGLGGQQSIGQPLPVDLPPAVQAGNGKTPGLTPGRVLALLPPLAELDVREGKSVNGHSPSASATPEHSNAGSPSTPDVPVAGHRVDDPEIPADLAVYLDDEMYALAAADGLTLEQIARMGRKSTPPDLRTPSWQRPDAGALNGSRPPSRPVPAGTEPQSLPTPQQRTDGKPLDQTSAGTAHPTPTTQQPRQPHPGLPAPARGSESSDSPIPTNDQILAYLDTHTGITVRQAATNLGVSESTVYRAKRARTQAVSSS